jgi:hypothetical protein
MRSTDKSGDVGTHVKVQGIQIQHVTHLAYSTVPYHYNLNSLHVVEIVLRDKLGYQGKKSSQHTRQPCIQGSLLERLLHAGVLHDNRATMEGENLGCWVTRQMNKNLTNCSRKFKEES